MTQLALANLALIDPIEERAPEDHTFDRMQARPLVASR
jgi:hypothetical protein